MSDLRDLYQEVILDHNRQPRNFGAIEQPTSKAEGYNPLCGDKLTLYLKVADGTVVDARFVGSGCAISKASASIMTETIKGKPVAEVDALFKEFHDMLTAGRDGQADVGHLGKLAVFAGVSEFPTRVKCATLAWHTLQAALHDPAHVVTTEDGT